MTSITRLAPLAGLACLVMFGCGRPADRTTPAANPAPALSRSDSRGPNDANLVSIEDEMLRDLRITVEAVESRPGGEQLSLLGELSVDQRAYAEVGVPVAARVTRVAVQAGAAVRGGQVLAELTSPALGRAGADYLSAKARAALADAALERKRELAGERIAPLREVQEAESAAAEARASLRAAAAEIAAFAVEPPGDDVDASEASRFVLRAPIAGLVIEQHAVQGQMLDPVTPAFRIGDLTSLWLTVHAFERDAVRISEGVVARIAFPALPGQDFTGTVTMVGRQVESDSRTVPIRIDVNNPARVLRPGMSATAVLPVGAAGAPILSVPVAAVQRVRNQWCVFVPKDPRTFEIRRIGRGRDLAGEVEVLSGLAGDESIVVDGAFLLKAHAEAGEANHDEH
jgi:cobalt-zinc-cadmium efflux system membrane fusion protein